MGKIQKKKHLLFFTSFILLLIFVFRNLLLNIGTNLIDWYDYPLLVWVINQNVDNILTGNLSLLFDTNMLYPHKNTLYLTDTLLLQSILSIPVRAFTTNPILTFNINFFLTFILNYVSAYLFWYLFFKNEKISFIGALLTVFSPHLFLQLGHFQMMNYWPMIFSLYFLFKTNNADKKILNTFLSGLFLAFQFLASAYIAIFLIVLMLVYFLAEIIYIKKYKESIKKFLIIIFTFLILDLVVIGGYVETKAIYSVIRDYGEYVGYSAHITDYIFSNPIRSLIHQSEVITKWNSFNKHGIGELATFPGFLLLITSILGVFTFKISKSSLSAKIKLDKYRFFFLIVIILGLVFSLGPRANFNGNYAHIPLPYHLVVKYIPLGDAIRTPARWSFLVYFGMIFFTLDFLKEKKWRHLFVVVLLLFALEYLPLNLETHQETYISNSDEVLKNVCKDNKKVVLEIPVTHFDADGGLIKGLNYITKTVLASSYHNCYIINGYTSYDLPEIQVLKDSLYLSLENEDYERFIEILRTNNVDILVVDEEKLLKEVKPSYNKMAPMLVDSDDVEVLEENIFIIKK